MEEQKESLKEVNVTRFNSTPLNLSFQNIISRVTCNIRKKDKIILNDVSGTFYSGRLSAILGPSGAGKTSLLNILAGYKTKGVTGNVLVNGQKRNAEKFRWQSCCIGQDSALLPLLTTRETMTIATELKMAAKIPRHQKQKIVSDIAELVGLQKALDTRVDKLSGGEMKRLSIGVELVTNPPIMLFDEPTSGLDSVSSCQIVSHLRSLARGGRNVVCVIHQPSSRIFDMFDDIHVVADGRIIYGGSVKNMLPVFQSAGFHCPQYYNRADFALEVASHQLEGNLNYLMTLAERQNSISSTSSTEDNHNIEMDSAMQDASSGVSSEYQKKFDEDNNDCEIINIENENHTHAYAISTWRQFYVLFKRSFTCTFRDVQFAQMRVLMHILVGIVLGAVYYKIGNEASKVVSNTAFLFFLLLFIFFANAMPSVLSFPQEAAVFQRESLNNWYSIPAYYFAKIISDLPLQLLCPTLFMIVAYTMTGQPTEACRVGMVWAVCVLFTVISQGWGLVSGIAFDPQMALFVLPAMTIPMLMFSGFFIRFDELPSYMSYLSYISYFGYGFEAIMQAVYGHDRPLLDCADAYCHFVRPNKYLEELGVRFSYTSDVMFLGGYIVLVYCTLYGVLKFRVWKSRQ